MRHPLRHPIPSSFRIAAPCVLVLLALGMPPGSRAQDTSRMRFVRWSYQDLASITTNTRPRDGLYVLGGIAVVGSVSLLDTYVSHEVKEGYRGVLATYVDVANELGGPNVPLPVVGIFAVSLFTPNTRFQDAAFTSMQTLAYSSALNQGIKFAVGRVRPEDTSSPYRFRPFSGNTSFPSGHANAVFSVLTPWAFYYPHPISYALLVAVGSGTALARISYDKHWFTDVVGGAVQGFLTAYWLTRRHQRLQASAPTTSHVSIVPSVGPEAIILTFRISC